MIRQRDGGTALLTMKLGSSSSLSEHMLGFESRRDAEEFTFLFQANIGEETAQIHIVPLTPAHLADMASEEQLAITVYAPGQLQLKPGMTVEQIQKAAAEAHHGLVVS